MSTLIPREPYTQDELEELYPSTLKLLLVQVLLRHGERSPVKPRFQNAGLSPFWPYCSAARQLVSTTMDYNSGTWGPMKWRRRLESFGSNDSPVITLGPKGEVDALCNLGELTDNGRKTTYALGKRLRHLYVNQLKFMPPTIQDTDMIYLRATPIPRALESLQQTFRGLYPPDSHSSSFSQPTVITRHPTEETLAPNEIACKRLAQLARAFGQRAADRWNKSKEMDYLNTLIGKWMPETTKKVAVDSHPRLSGIMDTINSTLSHGPATRLPKEFYDPKGRAIIDKIAVEEWFSGYRESQEFRSLGIGALMGDIVSRMVDSAKTNRKNDLLYLREDSSSSIDTHEEGILKLGLSGCHDTTIAGVLASLGVFENEKWPPYTSHVAIELFRKMDTPQRLAPVKPATESAAPAIASPSPSTIQSWFGRMFGVRPAAITNTQGDANGSLGPSRTRIEELEESDRRKLDGYFVRVRYNDEPMIIPGCQIPGRYLEGDKSLCTLEAFKFIVDKFTPRNWKQACLSNLDAPAFPASPEPAGY